MSADNIITEAITESSNLSKDTSSIITSYLVFDFKEFIKVSKGYRELKCDSECDIRTHLCPHCWKHAEYGLLNRPDGYFTHCLKCKPLIRCKNPKENRDRSRRYHIDKSYRPIDEFNEDIMVYINDFCSPYTCDFCEIETCEHSLWTSRDSIICMDCKNNMVLGLKMVKAFRKKPKTLEEFYSYI